MSEKYIYVVDSRTGEIAEGADITVVVSGLPLNLDVIRENGDDIRSFGEARPLILPDSQAERLEAAAQAVLRNALDWDGESWPRVMVHTAEGGTFSMPVNDEGRDAFVALRRALADAPAKEANRLTGAASFTSTEPSESDLPKRRRE